MHKALVENAWFIDEEKTKETVDGEGWIHTGDIAEIDQCGRIKIIDRVKVCVQLWLNEACRWLMMFRRRIL